MVDLSLTAMTDGTTFFLFVFVNRVRGLGILRYRSLDRKAPRSRRSRGSIRSGKHSRFPSQIPSTRSEVLSRLTSVSGGMNFGP